MDGAQVVHHVPPDVRNLPGLFLAHPVPRLNKGADKEGALLAGLLHKISQDPLGGFFAVFYGLLGLACHRLPPSGRKGVGNVQEKVAIEQENNKSHFRKQPKKRKTDLDTEPSNSKAILLRTKGRASKEVVEAWGFELSSSNVLKREFKKAELLRMMSCVNTRVCSPMNFAPDCKKTSRLDR